MPEQRDFHGVSIKEKILTISKMRIVLAPKIFFVKKTENGLEK